MLCRSFYQSEYWLHNACKQNKIGKKFQGAMPRNRHTCSVLDALVSISLNSVLGCFNFCMETISDLVQIQSSEP